MKRILFSAGTIAVLAAALVGGTGAFFSDTESSTGNTFAAGVIDLTIDNESYYNGNKCAPDANDIDQDENLTEYLWQGLAAYPVPGTSCTTSFLPSDLDNGLLFFDFRDLKPDDEGEDTISIHGGTNDAYVCMDMTLTSNDDNSSNEPELDSGDVADVPGNSWDGELAQNLQMLWWADDGDNVLEVGENILSGGVKTILNLATTSPFSVALADATHNVWASTTPGALPGGETRYIAKAWCYGTLAAAPLPAGTGVSPSVATGVTCDGTGLGNGTQTDGLTLDVAFRAVQVRNNPGYLCAQGKPRFATITVNKVVVNDNGGNNATSSFTLFLDGTVNTNVTSGSSTLVAPGEYQVAELGAQGYEATFSGDCDADGNITLADGDNKVCTITNDDLRAAVTLIKNVVGGVATPQQFSMRVNGTIVPSGNSRQVNSNTNVTITEDAFPGYTATGISGAGCPLNLGNIFQLNEGVSITCTITNTANP